MSEENKPEEAVEETQAQASAEENQETTQEATPSQSVSLDGMYGFKVGMASVYSDQGVQVPVTVLKVKPWVVTQLKNKESDQYEAVQISLLEKAGKNRTASEKGHLKKVDAGEKGASLTREIRQSLPEGIQVGQEVDVSSFEKGSVIQGTQSFHVARTNLSSCFLD